MTMHRPAAALISLCLLPAWLYAQGGNGAVSTAELGRKALSVVAANIRDKDPEVRAQAAYVLGQAGNRAAIGTLRPMLQDSNGYVRIAAARAVWELGSPEGLKTLNAIVSNAPARERKPSPLAELRTMAQNKIREKALEAMAEMRGEKAAATLQRMQEDEYGSVRDTAARELARLGRREELSSFTEALAAEDEGLRYEAATALARICQPGAAGALAALLEGEKASRVRMAAVEALGCAPDRREAAALLLKLAEDQNPTIRFKAVAALRGVPDQKAQLKLSEIVKATTDIRLKMAAHRAIVEAGGKADLAIPERGYTAVSYEVRLEALELFYNFPAEDVKPLLAAALDDEDVRVRLAAALQIIKRYSRK